MWDTADGLLRATVHLLGSGLVAFGRSGAGLFATLALGAALVPFVQEVLPGIIFHNLFN